MKKTKTEVTKSSIPDGFVGFDNLFQIELIKSKNR